MKNVGNFKMLIAFFVIIHCADGFVLAQQNKIEDLHETVEKLQQKISLLEGRVAEVEKLLLEYEMEELLLEEEWSSLLELFLLFSEDISTTNQDNINSEKWRVRQNWRMLEPDMLKEQVEEILGEPVRVTNFGYGYEIWNYGSGNVNFNDEKVSAWSEH